MKKNFQLIIAMLLLQTAEIEASCRNDLPITTPSEQFELADDGTVVDTSTGLMWARCGIGQSFSGTSCSGNLLTFSWAKAISEANLSNFAGYDDWRIPNIKELSSIIEESCYSPSINTSIFPNTESRWYWSSSMKINSSKKWSIYFDFGETDPIDHNGGYVRLVRGGK